MSDERPPTQVILEPARFTITPEMMRRYPVLFGDYSSLHTNEEFAKSSAYGRIIAWGVQPLFFLSILKWRRALPRRLALEKLTANFNQPVLPGDPLELVPIIYASTKIAGRVELEYEIRNRDSGVVVTTGSGQLVHAPAGLDPHEVAFDGGAPAGEERMQTQPLVEQTWEFDQIEKGHTSAFDFHFTLGALRSFYGMVMLGAESHAPSWADWIEAFDPRALCIAPMFTTVMGMLMPGRRATCANLEFELKQPPPLGECCRMKGAVAFKSASTQTLLEQMTISDLELKNVFATGKVHARVHGAASPDAR